MIPLRHEQTPAGYAVADGKLLGVRSEKELGARLPCPQPAGERHGDQQGFTVARRHVDEQVADFPAHHGLQMFADGVDVPAVDVRRARLHHRPCLRHELFQMLLGPQRFRGLGQFGIEATPQFPQEL